MIATSEHLNLLKQKNVKCNTFLVQKRFCFDPAVLIYSLLSPEVSDHILL